MDASNHPEPVDPTLLEQENHASQQENLIFVDPQHILVNYPLTIDPTPYYAQNIDGTIYYLPSDHYSYYLPDVHGSYVVPQNVYDQVKYQIYLFPSYL